LVGFLEARLGFPVESKEKKKRGKKRGAKLKNFPMQEGKGRRKSHKEERELFSLLWFITLGK
jgi:hypothetical protein